MNQNLLKTETPQIRADHQVDFFFVKWWMCLAIEICFKVKRGKQRDPELCFYLKISSTSFGNLLHIMWVDFLYCSHCFVLPVTETTKCWKPFPLLPEHLYKPSKFLGVSRLALLYDVDEVVREDERHTLPLDAKLWLEVAQNVTKVYVEKLWDKKSQRVRQRRTNWRLWLLCWWTRVCLTCPVLRTMMLSLWRSPMPRT